MVTFILVSSDSVQARPKNASPPFCHLLHSGKPDDFSFEQCILAGEHEAGECEDGRNFLQSDLAIFSVLHWPRCGYIPFFSLTWRPLFSASLPSVHSSGGRTSKCCNNFFTRYLHTRKYNSSSIMYPHRGRPKSDRFRTDYSNSNP
jgi:hypothetical protein